MDLRLKGKCAIVTGGTRNLGRHIAFGFLREGATVLTTYVHDDVAAQHFFAEVPEALKPNVRMYKLDISSDVACRDLCAKALEEFGTLDVIVNNAALNHFEPLEDIDDEDFDRVMHNTLRTTLYMTRAAFTVMKPHGGGRIVNLSTAGVYTANPNELVYLCAKAGVEALTRAFARLGAGENITVNAVAPHVISSGMGLGTIRHDPSIIERIPLRRMGRVEELVALVLYLSSEISEYMTGQVLGLNGGRLMR
jgi:3-oxoacyl-[acyl-carrier protein] reductase